MAGVNETPRQKMMGILYLVLLGLAATTISQKVLESFRNLTVGLEASTNNVQTTIDRTFASFAAGTLKDDPSRAKPFWDRANKVKTAVETLNKYIVETKGVFEKEVGGVEEDGELKNREDMDISPRIMLGTPTKPGRAKDLKKLIEDTKTTILAQLDAKDRAGFKMSLNADDPPKRKGEPRASWEETFFGEGIPLTAAITALTKVQADLKNTESEAIKKILGDVSKTDLVLDQYAAVAVPTSSTYVLLGQQYSAEVFLTAFSNSLNPDITVGGQKLNVAGGKGTYTVSASREGEFKWSAVLHMKKADGSVGEWKTPEMSYRVERPSAVVSPDKLSIFYIGVDNPVSVSAPGTSKEKLRISLSAGTATGSKGAYIVNVKQSGNVTVSIFSDENGKSVKLGEQVFRCKRIPPAHASFGGKSGGVVPKAQMSAGDRIFVKAEDFDFPAAFTVSHFKVFIRKPRADAMILESTSDKFTPAIKAALAGVVSGTAVVFDEIFATGPDGIKKPVDAIVYNIQ